MTMPHPHTPHDQGRSVGDPRAAGFPIDPPRGGQPDSPDSPDSPLTDDEIAEAVAQWPAQAQLRLAARLLNQACDAATAARPPQASRQP
jgi:hypothetical protein